MHTPTTNRAGASPSAEVSLESKLEASIARAETCLSARFWPEPDVLHE